MARFKSKSLGELSAALSDALIPTAVEDDSSIIDGGWYTRWVGGRQCAKQREYQGSFSMTLGMSDVNGAGALKKCLAEENAMATWIDERIAQTTLTFSTAMRLHLSRATEGHLVGPARKISALTSCLTLARSFQVEPFMVPPEA